MYCYSRFQIGFFNQDYKYNISFWCIAIQDFKLEFSTKITNMTLRLYWLLQPLVVHIYLRKGAIEERMNKNLPKHQQGDHGNQLEGQTHSSDHCDEPERTKGKRLMGMNNIDSEQVLSERQELLW